MVYYVPLVWVSCEFDSHCRLQNMSYNNWVIILLLICILLPYFLGGETNENSESGEDDSSPDDGDND